MREDLTFTDQCGGFGAVMRKGIGNSFKGLEIQNDHWNVH